MPTNNQADMDKEWDGLTANEREKINQEFLTANAEEVEEREELGKRLKASGAVVGTPVKPQKLNPDGSLKQE